MMTDRKVTIAGAGLVGSLLAVMLKKKGFDVTIIEKRSDMRKETGDAGRSINLVVTSRGINALKQVDLWKEVQKIVIPVHGRQVHDQKGETVYQPYGRDNSECNYSVSRSGINQLLMTEAENLGVRIQFDSPLASIDISNKQLVFKNDQTQSYEILVGADGGGSIVRQELMKFIGGDSKTIRFSGDYKEMLMPADEKGNYPIEKNVLHIWPRGAEMLMALPNLDGSFTMTLYMPADRFKEVGNRDSLKSYFEQQYGDAVSLMPNYVEDFFENPQGFLGTVKCSPWVFEDSVCLVGDAAHAVVPFFGQGMNCGFEDCYYLMKFLEEEKDWEKAFDRYNRFQKPNADAIADMAVENAREMSEKVGDSHFLLQKKVEHKIENAFPDKYRSRYGMVTYTLIPYAMAYQAGHIQKDILNELSHGLESVEQLDLKKAEALINQQFLPFVSKNNLNLTRYRP